MLDQELDEPQGDYQHHLQQNLLDVLLLQVHPRSQECVLIDSKLLDVTQNLVESWDQVCIPEKLLKHQGQLRGLH